MKYFIAHFPPFPISYFSRRSMNYPHHPLLKPPRINVCSKPVWLTSDIKKM